jgi:hypothetical protein
MLISLRFALTQSSLYDIKQFVWNSKPRGRKSGAYRVGHPAVCAIPAVFFFLLHLFSAIAVGIL